jgi:hypothetical protein
VSLRPHVGDACVAPTTDRPLMTRGPDESGPYTPLSGLYTPRSAPDIPRWGEACLARGAAS